VLEELRSDFAGLPALLEQPAPEPPGQAVAVAPAAPEPPPQLDLFG
jgi:hypothetical protein